MKAAESYGLPRPEIQAFDDMFRVNLFRSSSPMADWKNKDDSVEEHRGNIGETSEKD